jgi:hypothetical protein
MKSHIEMFPSAKTLLARSKPRYQYTIKHTDGTIHTFKTLKDAKASRIGYDDLSPITGGMRIIARVRIEPKTLNPRYWNGLQSA